MYCVNNTCLTILRCYKICRVTNLYITENTIMQMYLQ